MSDDSVCRECSKQTDAGGMCMHGRQKVHAQRTGNACMDAPTWETGGTGSERQWVRVFCWNDENSVQSKGLMVTQLHK